MYDIPASNGSSKAASSVRVVAVLETINRSSTCVSMPSFVVARSTAPARLPTSRPTEVVSSSGKDAEVSS